MIMQTYALLDHPAEPVRGHLGRDGQQESLHQAAGLPLPGPCLQTLHPGYPVQKRTQALLCGPP